MKKVATDLTGEKGDLRRAKGSYEGLGRKGEKYVRRRKGRERSLGGGGGGGAEKILGGEKAARGERIFGGGKGGNDLRG